MAVWARHRVALGVGTRRTPLPACLSLPTLQRSISKQRQPDQLLILDDSTARQRTGAVRLAGIVGRLRARAHGKRVDRVTNHCSRGREDVLWLECHTHSTRFQFPIRIQIHSLPRSVFREFEQRELRRRRCTASALKDPRNRCSCCVSSSHSTQRVTQGDGTCYCRLSL